MLYDDVTGCLSSTSVSGSYVAKKAETEIVTLALLHSKKLTKRVIQVNALTDMSKKSKDRLRHPAL